MATFTPITSLDLATSPETITAALLPATAGISIDTTSLHVVSGATSIGTYDGSLGALGIGSGLILTSGTMPGLSNTASYFGISNGMTGDADLNAVVNSVFQTISYDATTLSVNFTVSDPNITAISFNLVFGSDEYPEWVNQFVDIGVVLVNGVNVAYFNGDSRAPLSVIGSNLANGYFINNADSHLPIEYDGVSAPLTVFAPVHQGLNTLKIGVADTGDHIYDSGLIISNMVGSNSPVYGVTLDLDGTELDDNLHGGNVGENIHGLGGNDSCWGGSGDDVINGDDGDDTLSGDFGNDYLNGGNGIDVALYAGGAANYQVVAYTDGTVKVVDLVGVGPAGEGQDLLTGIESLQFADASIDVATLEKIAPPPVGGAVAPPVVTGPALLTVTEDGSTTGLGMDALLAGATSAGFGDILSITGLPAQLPAGVTFTTVPGGFLAPPTSTLWIDPKNAAFQNLAAGETTEISVTYNVTNAAGSTANTAVFTVVGTNDAPVVTAALAAAAVEGDAALTVDLLANAADVDNGAVLTVVETPLPPVVVAPPPTQNGNGNGNHGGDTPPPPPPPTGSALVSGAYTLSTLPAGISFDAATQSFAVDPSDPNFQRLSEGQVANLTIHYGISDGTTVTATSALISITGTNDLPVVNGSLALTVAEGSVVAFNPLANVADADVFDTLSIISGPLPAGVSLNGFNGNAAAYQNLAVGETATVTWDYSVSDGHVTVANSATFTVIGTNDAPVIAVPAAAAMAEDGAPVTVSAIAGATDVDHGAVLAVVNVPAILPDGISYDAVSASFTIDPSNAVFQQLAQGESQVYTVAYGISDGLATTATSVRFTVIGNNDLPVITGPTTGTPNEGGNVVSVNATGNATDVDDHNGLQVTGVPEVLPAGVSYDAFNQEFRLNPNDAAFQYLSKGETAQVKIDYNIFDGFVELPTSVIFTVTGENDRPFATGTVEAGSVSENAGPVGLNLLTNIVDVDHLDALTVRTNQGTEPVLTVSGAAWTAPVSYSLVGNQINLDPAQFNGLRGGETLDLNFSYIVTDGSADGDAFGNTHLSIVGANDAPTAVAISAASISENATAGAVVGQFSTTDGDRDETFSYQLLDDPSGYFAISGSRLVVATGAAIDYEAASSRSVQVQVTDADGASFARSFNIAINNVGGVTIAATNKADVINTTQADSKLRSTNEEDSIDGKSDNDVIDAGGGNDNILGGDGNDTITGGAGNDAINGGAGTDVAVYTGTWLDHDVSLNAGVTTIVDRRAGAPNGSDSLQAIETIRFANGSFSAASVVNSGPVANADIAGGLIEASAGDAGVASVAGNVIANDSDANLATAGLGETLAVSGIRSGTPGAGGNLTAVAGTTVIAGSYGSLSIAANGSYSYQLDNARPATEALATGSSASDVFTYELRDAHGATSVAQLSFAIAGRDEVANSAPVGSASATLAGGVEDTSYSISSTDLLAGFSDADGDPLAVAGLVASNGSVTANADGSFTITPGANFNGAVTLGYSVVDGRGGSVAATQHYAVAAVNDLPGGSASAVLTAGSQNQPYTVGAASLLQGFSDVDGDALAIAGLSASDGSVAANADGSFTITPSAGFNGQVTLAYQVVDGHGGSVAATQTYSVAAVNSAPTGAATASLAAGVEDAAYSVGAADLLAGFSDADGDTLGVASLTASNGSVTANADGSFTITPTANFNGPVTLGYSVVDGKGGSVAATQSYSVAAVNDLPVGSAGASLANGAPNQPYTVSAASLLQGFADVDGDALAVAGLSASDGSVSANADGSFTITPLTDFAGTMTLSYSVVDGNGGSVVATQSYAVGAAVNVAPTGSATAALAAGVEDTPYTVSAASLLQGFSDANGDTLGVDGLSASNGSVTANANGSFTITPGADYNGAVTLNYNVSDGNGGSIAATQAYALVAVNDAPTALAISSAQIAENAAAGTQVGLLSATDPDLGDGFSYQLVDDPRGYFAVSGNRLVVAASAAIDFEAGATAPLQVRVTDTAGAASIHSLNINIANVAGATINASNKVDNISPTGAAGLRSTSEEDNIDARADNDVIDAGGGNDTIIGGAGNDNINGGAGDDTIVLTGTEGQGDTINGGTAGEFTGDRILVQGTGAVTLANFDAAVASIENWVGNGASLGGTTAANRIDLSYLKSVSGLSFVDGGAGNDILTGSSFNDELRGGAGVDTLSGGNGDDRLVVAGSEALTDLMNGGAGSDTLVINGTTALSLQGFNSLTNGIEAIQGNNLGINGTASADTFNFSGLSSISGVSFVDAGDGGDSVVGSGLADVLRGGAGNDNITGGGGNDQLSGGVGADTFVFNAGFGSDTISDFLAGSATGHDVIDLSSALFADFAAVQAAMTQVGSNVVIDAGAEGSITLAGTTVAALVSADFAFH